MSLIMNKVSFKKALVLGVIVATLFSGTSAFALSSISTANLNMASKANGNNINIWEGRASMSATNKTTGEPTLSATIKKSVGGLPDTTVYNHNMFSQGSYSNPNISIPDRSTYYAQASTLNPLGNATVKVKSHDK